MISLDSNSRNPSPAEYTATGSSYKQLESIFAVLHKKASVPPGEVLDPLNNVIVTDYTVGVERQLFDGIVESFRTKLEKGKTCSSEEWESLRFFCNRLRTSEMEVINAKKKATETTTLLNTQFDAGQVLSLVKQLPSMIQKELDSLLGSVFTDVVETPNHPLLGKMRAFEIAKITNMISDRLSSLIDNITIPGSHEEQQNGNAEASASLRDVEGMLNSLITEKIKTDSNTVDAPSVMSPAIEE